MNTRAHSTWLLKILFVSVAVAALVLPALAKPLAPGPFNKTSPVNNATDVSTSPTLAWTTSNTATDYEYCYDSTVNGACDGPWTSTSGATSVNLSGLNTGTAYDWQVRAVAGGVRTYADLGDWWTFTTGCPNSISVTNNLDSGAGSLRQALADVCAGGSINFDNDYTIVLSSGTLAAAKSITISGVGHSVAVDGAGLYRVFNATAPITLTHLIIQNGSAADTGAGLNTALSATLLDTQFISNTASRGGGVYAAGAVTLNGGLFQNNTSTTGTGGGLDAESTLTLIDTQFISNTAELDGGGVFAFNAATLNSGLFQGNTSRTSTGGGLYAASTLTLIDTQFISNTASTHGGGVYAESTLVLTGTQFFSNTAQFGGGASTARTASLTDATFSGNKAGLGSLPGGGGAELLGTATIQNSVFQNNVADNGVGGGSGGGIQLAGSANVTVIDTAFTGNQANGASDDGGGAIMVYAGSLNLDADIENNGTASRGGALSVMPGATITVANSLLENNNATQNGGALANQGTLLIRESAVVSNTAHGNGGGLFIDSNATATVNESSIRQNMAVHDGGGIFTDMTSTLTIANTTFYTNTGVTGGGLSNFGSVTVTNSTISGNAASLGSGDGGDGIYNDATLNLVNSIVTQSSNHVACNDSGHLGISSNNLSDDSCPGTAVTGDPLFGPLGQYGGATSSLPLLPGSPAINAGNNCTVIDQRGIARPQGAACDIGAFESQGFTLSKAGGDNQQAVIDTAFANPLAVTVTSAFDEPVNGGQVTFVGPLSGMGVTPITQTATIVSGAASVTVTANSVIGGPYNVVVSASGATNTLFALTNKSTLAYIYLPLIIR
jgi:predicted outer membrane repeat protein